MIDKVVVYRTKLTRQWRWHYLASGNHKKLAHGGEGYYNLPELLASLSRVLDLREDDVLQRFSNTKGCVGTTYRKGQYQRIRIEVRP